MKTTRLSGVLPQAPSAPLLCSCGLCSLTPLISGANGAQAFCAWQVLLLTVSPVRTRWDQCIQRITFLASLGKLSHLSNRSVEFLTNSPALAFHSLPATVLSGHLLSFYVILYIHVFYVVLYIHAFYVVLYIHVFYVILYTHVFYARMHLALGLTYRVQQVIIQSLVTKAFTVLNKSWRTHQDSCKKILFWS